MLENDTLLHTCRCRFLALKYIYVHTLKDGYEVSWSFAVKVKIAKTPLRNIILHEHCKECKL